MKVDFSMQKKDEWVTFENALECTDHGGGRMTMTWSDDIIDEEIFLENEEDVLNDHFAYVGIECPLNVEITFGYQHYYFSEEGKHDVWTTTYLLLPADKLDKDFIATLVPHKIEHTNSIMYSASMYEAPKREYHLSSTELLSS